MTAFLPHEPIDARELRTIPVAARRKLVECGVELELASWRKLPPVARDRLVQMRVELGAERAAFAQLILWLQQTFLDTIGVLVQAPLDLPWRAVTPPSSVPLSADVWRELSVDARFAVLEAATAEERAVILAALARSATLQG